MRPYTVAIGGGSGAGKTTLCRMLEDCGLPAGVIHEDDLYLDDETFPMVGQWRNWELSECIDRMHLRQVVLSLQRGEGVTTRSLDHKLRIRTEKVMLPRNYLFVEGRRVLEPDCLDLYDKMIFLETDPNTLWKRRLSKDPSQREYLDAVVMPEYYASILAHREIPGVTVVDTTAPSELVLQRILSLLPQIE